MLSASEYPHTDHELRAFALSHSITGRTGLSDHEVMLRAESFVHYISTGELVDKVAEHRTRLEAEQVAKEEAEAFARFGNGPRFGEAKRTPSI